jgi:hypothetical protein
LKKQLKIGIISLVVTLIVLVSGYQGYLQLLVKKPIVDMLYNQKGISIQNIHLNLGNNQLQLQIKPDYPFIAQFPEVTAELDKILGQGKWQIVFPDPKSTDIKNSWQEMTFGVREGIESNRYTEIQNTVVKIANKYHLSNSLAMDEHYVYLVLRDGKQIWYQLLPLKVVK